MTKKKDIELKVKIDTSNMEDAEKAIKKAREELELFLLKNGEAYDMARKAANDHSTKEALNNLINLSSMGLDLMGAGWTKWAGLAKDIPIMLKGVNDQSKEYRSIVLRIRDAVTQLAMEESNSFGIKKREADLILLNGEGEVEFLKKQQKEQEKLGDKERVRADYAYSIAKTREGYNRSYSQMFKEEQENYEVNLAMAIEMMAAVNKFKTDIDRTPELGYVHLELFGERLTFWRKTQEKQINEVTNALEIKSAMYMQQALVARDAQEKANIADEQAEIARYHSFEERQKRKAQAQEKSNAERIAAEEKKFQHLEELQIKAEDAADAAKLKKELSDRNILENEAVFEQGLSELKAIEEEERRRSLEESLDDSIELREEYNEEIVELQENLQGDQLGISGDTNDSLEQGEAESQKTRLSQWQEYAEKVSAVSKQVSEITKLATDSLGSMFGQLSASYSQEIESLNEKITAVDEEKKEALERVALTEEERSAKEEEIAQQKIDLEYATSEEQRVKADERIATLQGELSAEDTINREFASKKEGLEKEKEKKEKAKKKAEKMQKRLQMGQAIVEAIGNVAQGVAKALSLGPIIGPILAGIVGAAGAVQLGYMHAQINKLEDGGLLRGKRHRDGGMRIEGSNIEVEGGEYVVNRKSTARNLGLLRYINGERRELGADDLTTYFAKPFALPTFGSPFAAMMEQGGQVPMLLLVAA